MAAVLPREGIGAPESPPLGCSCSAIAVPRVGFVGWSCSQPRPHLIVKEPRQRPPPTTPRIGEAVHQGKHLSSLNVQTLAQPSAPSCCWSGSCSCRVSAGHPPPSELPPPPAASPGTCCTPRQGSRRRARDRSCEPLRAPPPSGHTCAPVSVSGSALLDARTAESATSRQGSSRPPLLRYTSDYHMHSPVLSPLQPTSTLNHRVAT